MPLPSNGIAVPGQPLGSTSDYITGPGICTRHDGYLCATIVGQIHVDNRTTPPTLSLHPTPTITSSPTGLNPTTILPQVGSTVLCRVTRTNPRQANVAIFALDIPTTEQGAEGEKIVATTSIPTGDTFPGAIRVQDVRATEKDKVRIAASFKPGDIVRATVISLGDQSNYYLSTGRNELGVVVARSGELVYSPSADFSCGVVVWAVANYIPTAYKADSGDLLYPKSWKEMICSRTGIVEGRKVAKPI